MKTLRLLVATLAVTLGLASTAGAQTYVFSNITTNTTWGYSGSPYIVEEPLAVAPNVTLTIEPGVQVFVGSASLNGFPIDIEGTLLAQGTQAAPITFTGNDVPWGGLRFKNSLGNLLEWVNIIDATAPDETWDSTYPRRGGGVRMADSYAQFSHVTITLSLAAYRGGAVFITGYNSNASFSDCEFRNNQSGDMGGGVAVYGGAFASFTRCLIAENASGVSNGGAIYAFDAATVSLLNCTVANNQDTPSSSAIYVGWNASLSATNSIVWGNTGGILNDTGIPENVAVSYSDVPVDLWPGANNISTDPFLLGDYTLQSTSPAIDAGDPQSPLDPDGTRADMGAIYFPQQQPVQQYLQLPTATVPAGTAGDFAITGTVVGNETGTGVKITFTIDPSAVQSVALVSTPFPNAVINPDGNTIHLSLASEENVTITNGTIATLSFTAPANAVRSTTPLTWVTLTQDPQFGTSINEQPVALLIPGTVSIPDNPPVWTQEPRSFPEENAPPILEGVSLVFTIQASDQDNDPITYSMSGLPEPGPQGPYLNSATGEFWWTPTYDQAGVYTVTFTASTTPGQPAKPAWNGVDVSIQKTVTITVTNVDRAPTWVAATGDRTVAEGAELTFTITATDPDPEDVAGIVYTAIGLPTGASLNSETGAFSWIPGYDQSGIYPITFKATSGPDNLSVSEVVTITVTNTNQAPVWTQTPPQSVNENATLSFTVSATDPDDQELAYDFVSMPSGANFTPSTREFFWKPTFDQAGGYTATFRVTDGEAWVDMQVLITVNNVNRAPEWDPTADQEIAEGSLLSVGVNVNDPDGDQLEVTLVNNPSGATLDGLWFRWTPGYDAAPGVYEVTLRAWDGAAEAFDTFFITVTNTNRPPEWSPVQPQAVAEGQTLVFQVSATDLDGQTLTYSAPDLPTGATFDAPNRTFSWTPNYLQSGFYSVTFYVSDGEATVPQSVQIDVVDVPQPPVWGTMPTPAPVGAGLPVTFTVSATDPFAEGVWYGLEESPGSIDPESGVFTWTPDYNVEGNITIVVTATNRDGTSYAEVTVNVFSRYGDATDNGTVDAADASAVLKYSVKLPVQINTILADVTGNEMVTAYDAALILHKVIVDPGYRFPVQNQQAHKIGSGLPASLVWERVSGGWALRATNAFGLMAGEFTLTLPGGAPVNVTGGDMIAFRQDGDNLFVSVIGSNFADGTLFFIQTEGGQPGILSASLNEGTIPVVAAAPSAFTLEQNAPNPFNPSTTIRFALPEASQVNLVVYDVNGRAIRTLASGSFSAGMHSVVWDARDDGGREVASGTYLYRITTDKGTFVKRMTLLK